ncbi:MAG: Hpt domain-containing protein, partial [Oscillospiraceae bacterium]|nr:Hpt domain-containing protein [Oscillospiraceae bacterium]
AVLRMCGKESMLAKFVLKFPNDTTFSSLISAYEGGDMETAFRMSHTLKGLCLNLGLDKLLESSAALTEGLRDYENVAENVPELLENVKRDYEAAVAAIRSVDS